MQNWSYAGEKQIKWGEKDFYIVGEDDKTLYLLGDDNLIKSVCKQYFHKLIKESAIKKINHKGVRVEVIHAIEIINKADSEHLKVANDRNKVIQAFFKGDNYEKYGITNGTIRHWVKKYREAEKEYKVGFIGLIPSTRKSYDLKNKTSLNLLSYKTNLRINHQNKAIESNLKIRKVKKEIGPLDKIHMDYTLLDIDLYSCKTGGIIGRPWLTLLIDDYSKKVLSFYLSYEPPSDQSIIETIKDVCEKYERIPKKIVVNKSIVSKAAYLKSFLFNLGIDIEYVPPYQSNLKYQLIQSFNSMEEVIREKNKCLYKKDNIGWTLSDLHSYISNLVYQNIRF